jgi:hypothetical protein
MTIHKRCLSIYEDNITVIGRYREDGIFFFAYTFSGGSFVAAMHLSAHAIIDDGCIPELTNVIFVVLTVCKHSVIIYFDKNLQHPNTEPLFQQAVSTNKEKSPL